MPNLKIIEIPVLEKRFLKVFTINGRGSHLGHVTWTIDTNLGSPLSRTLHIKFGFDWPAVSEEKMFENGERQQRRRSMGIL